MRIIIWQTFRSSVTVRSRKVFAIREVGLWRFHCTCVLLVHANLRLSLLTHLHCRALRIHLC